MNVFPDWIFIGNVVLAIFIMVVANAIMSVWATSSKKSDYYKVIDCSKK